MVYIFLDVDGVLNNAHTKGIRQGLCWLDNENIAVFAEFVRYCHERYGEENIKIILSSSWRRSSFPDKSDAMASFLEERLKKDGISIDGETENLNTWSRGTEIMEFLLRNRENVEHYLVLDDVLWEDFKPLGITKHWVQTADDPRNGLGGLRKKHLRHAKEVIHRPVTFCELNIAQDIISKKEAHYEQ